MKFEYHDTFASHADDEYPVGWQLERHSALSHRHAYVQNGAFALMLPGNRHLPVTPNLDDFTLEAVCRGGAHFREATGLVLFFRYAPRTQCGYYIHLQWGRAGVRAAFGICERGALRPLQERRVEQPAVPVETSCAIRLTVSGARFEAACGDTVFEPFEDPSRTFSAGRVAVDHSGAADHKVLGRHVFLESFHVAAARELNARTVWSPVRIELPSGLNGMQKPFVFELSAHDFGGCTLLAVRLSGGSIHQPPECPGGFYTCNEELIRPYVRLETVSGAEFGRCCLVNGMVGLRVSEDLRNFRFYPADAECPLERTFYFDEFPPNARLFVGYAFYRHQLAPYQSGGPIEVWADPADGRLKYVGAPLQAGIRALEVHSPDDKAILRRLPADDPRRERALAFARANHFFVEGEPCAFRALLRFRDPTCLAAEWRADARLENAFREALPAKPRLEAVPAEDPLSDSLSRELGVVTLACAITVPEALPVGVYHLVVSWNEGGKTVAETRRAFEVMPTDPRGLPAPLVSGLPELHSFPDEARGVTTNAFDPWAGETVDVCHYLTGVYYQADFARAQKVWKTLHAYGRQFQFIQRNCGTRNSADYVDVIREADLVCATPAGMSRRFDLWKRAIYRGEVLETLRRFVDEHVPDADERRRLTEADPVKGVLTPAAFTRLVERYWKPWLDAMSRFANGIYREGGAAWVRSLNPRARWTLLYAVCPPYASNYKAGYFPLYTGFDVTLPPIRTWGPLFLEDYPLLCRYAIWRGVFQLAALKLVAPDMTLFLEMYPGASVPVDGLLMSGNPPYSLCRAPPAYFRKRLLAFTAGAVWFGPNGFSYWKDNGFHARSWEREHYDVLLETWGQIRNLRPAKPVRSAAYAFSFEACRRHPDYLHQDPSSAWGEDVYNTAEESTAYAYDQAQGNGTPIGFLLDLNAVGKLDPADTDTLVLPPLGGLEPGLLKAIRELHSRGVNLVGFEDITGLEDLFGVAPRDAAPVAGIRLNPERADESPWSELAGLEENCGHPLCRTCYRLNGARAVLDGFDCAGAPVGPVLTWHRTAWGETALWCVPPTVVNRADQRIYVQYGQACLSQLMNRAMALVLRRMARPLVETSVGKVLAFHSADGAVRVIVMEDAWPDTPRAIEPRVTLRLPGVRPEAITCDRPFAVLSAVPGAVSLRLHLDPHDSAVLCLARCEAHPSGDLI